MKRSFDPCLVEYGDKRVRGYRITCGRCSTPARVPVNTISGTMDNGEQEARLIARKFTNEGWFVGDIASKDRCPKCVRRAREIAKHAPNGGANVPQQSTVEAPQQMSRGDRRIIFAKLEEVFADEQTGYQPGWTDSKVATDLGVPLAWVKTAREENFGPAGINPEITQAMADATAWRTDAVELAKKLDAAKAQVGQLMAEGQRLASRGEMIERKLAAIEKAVRA